MVALAWSSNVAGQTAPVAQALTEASGDVDADDAVDRYEITEYELLEPRHRVQDLPLVVARPWGALSVRTLSRGAQRVLHDAWSRRSPRQSIEMRTIYDDGRLLSPRRIEALVSRAGTTALAVLQVGEADDAMLSVFSAPAASPTRVMRYPQGTITFAALLRLVPTLPSEPGRRWTVDHVGEALQLTVTSGSADAPITLSCEGPDAVALADGAVACTRYTLDFAGRRPPVGLWVDPQRRRVVQFTVGSQWRATLGAPDPFRGDPVLDALMPLASRPLSQRRPTQAADPP